MKLHQLIRTGGLALALAAGTLAGGCDDDDPAPAKDGSADATASDAGASDAGKPDATVTPDTGITPADAGSDTSTPDGGAADSAADATESDATAG
jgi:hypothetical protein